MIGDGNWIAPGLRDTGRSSRLQNGQCRKAAARGAAPAPRRYGNISARTCGGSASSGHRRSIVGRRRFSVAVAKRRPRSPIP